MTASHPAKPNSRPTTGKEIRQSFTDFFAAKGHVIVPSSSLVPDNDPTLMFTNSGMVQFKNNFTGVDTRLKRAASVQRCVRAGGKHNDLENVGHTARHHTFFEMLGNFSFGDYFKQESLEWGWQWVTEVLQLDPARICVTHYAEDEEARKIWRQIGVADKDIIAIGTSDNFWTMGETGPCGPCSEIFYDLDPSGQMYGDRPGTKDEDGDRWMEIWNHVFTQFDLQPDGSKKPLENKNIDTGAGLERLMCAVQGVQSNYDTDIFQSIIQAACKHVGVADYHAIKGAEQGVSLRVIADHLRAMTFLLVDGVVPGNEGRGYVLRRIMRRAMRHGTLLGMEKPFIHQLVPTLVGVMGEAYPELQRGARMAADVIELEEQRFGRTLKQGLESLNFSLSAEALRKYGFDEGFYDVNGVLIDQSKSDFDKEFHQYTLEKQVKLANAKSQFYLSGEKAFQLYDTFGFPLDLTEDALKSLGAKVEINAFNKCLEEQRARSRAAHKGTGDTATAEVWFDVQDGIGSTEFLGYQTLTAEAVAEALVKDGQRVDTLKDGETGHLVTKQTPFYAESGGQVGDTGTILVNEGAATLTVTDTRKVLDGLFVHEVTVTKGQVKQGDTLSLQVDPARRAAIARNHTATHLLFAGLRHVLGAHVVQRGSRQDDHLTRFDISHPKAITPAELQQVEDFVNAAIWANLPVVTRIVDKDNAMQSGATAQFGEKYGDEVRVVYMGTPDSASLVTADLCGGTHVAFTGELGLFRFTAEGSVSAGVRRVEGITHAAAFQSFRTESGLLKDAAAALKCKPADLPIRVAELQQNAKKAAKAPATASVDIASLYAGHTPLQGKLSGVVAVVASVPEAEGDALRGAVEELKTKLGSGVVLLGSQQGNKATLVAGVTKDLTAKVAANALLTEACRAIQGRGGGRPELAMGGGEGDVTTALQAGQAFLQA